MILSVIISIILGVLFLAAIVAIIVIVVVGKKDLKDDFKALVKYGIEKMNKTPNPNESAAYKAKFTATVDTVVAAVKADNYNCIANVFADNFSPEQQIVILGSLSKEIVIDGTTPQNIKDIHSVYISDLNKPKLTKLLTDVCNCDSKCEKNPDSKEMIKDIVNIIYNPPVPPVPPVPPAEETEGFLSVIERFRSKNKM